MVKSERSGPGGAMMQAGGSNLKRVKDAEAAHDPWRYFGTQVKVGIEPSP
jgi:hypothetical protein